MTRWFWLSFADPEAPEGEQFLGVIIMPVSEMTIAFIDEMRHDDIMDGLPEENRAFFVAVQMASFLQLNPGGEVQGCEITQDIWRVPMKQRAKLLSKDELESTGLGKPT